MRPAVAITSAVVAMGGGLLAHHAQPQADEGRRELTAQQEMLVMPAPGTIRLVSQGLHSHVAVVMWVRSVLEFGERIDKRRDDSWQTWFAKMIECVVELDPKWRTPHFYGGVMLRVTGSTELSTEVFKSGAENLPDDPYFPFSVGMNYYLLDEDFEEAAVWLDRAAALPDAPPWYQMTAVSMRTKGQGREGAVMYLRSELEQTADPALRARIEERILNVTHDELAERLTEAVASLEARGVEVTDLQQLVDEGIVTHLPEEPYGGEWEIDEHYRDVLGSDRMAMRLRSEIRAERKLFRWMAN